MADLRSQLQDRLSGSYEMRCSAALVLTAGLLAGIGCSPSAPASFVNRVWVVAESPQVTAGETRVFLSDGTLVMTSPQGTPAFGAWRVRDGQLTITEESRDYPVDVLELSADVFRIRIRGPGEPVVIRFAPAEQTIVAVKAAH